MKKNFYLIFFLTFFSGTLFLAGDNIVQANYQCSTSGIAYTDQATCQSNCVQTASCYNQWAMCSGLFENSNDYISDWPMSAKPGNCVFDGSAHSYPGSAGGCFDSNCNITSWSGDCDYGNTDGCPITPGQVYREKDQCGGWYRINNRSSADYDYTCPLSNPNQTGYCAASLSGSTGWLYGPNYIYDLDFFQDLSTTPGTNLNANTNYCTFAAGCVQGEITVNNAGITLPSSTIDFFYFSSLGNTFYPISTVSFVGAGNQIDLILTDTIGQTESGSFAVDAADFSGGATVGTPGVALRYFSMSGSGNSLTIEGYDANWNYSSGSLTMSCPAPNYCDANHQCSAPSTCTYVAPPTCSMYFSSNSITAGQGSAAHWMSANASGATLSCTGPVPGTASVGTSGSWLSQYNSSGTENCTLTVTGSGGTGSCNASLTVNPAIVNGTCGTANGTTSCTAPSANLCSSGTSSAVTGSGPWSWTCTGSNGGTTASCGSNIVTPAACGSANGSSYCSAPTLNLCNSGTASSVTGSGPWAWTCTNTCGDIANCSANQSPSINGACGSANGTPATTEPITNLCNFGSSSAVTGSGPWSWSCNGTCSGTSASCSTTPNTDWKEVSPN